MSALLQPPPPVPGGEDDAALRWVSAWLDGEAAAHEPVPSVHAVAGQPDPQQAWVAYQAIGQVLRGEPLSVQPTSEDYLARLRLAALGRPNEAFHAVENVATKPLSTPDAVLKPRKWTPKPAANDRWWWRVAGVAAVGLVLWAVAPGLRPVGGPQVARLQPAADAPAAQQAVAVASAAAEHRAMHAPQSALEAEVFAATTAPTVDPQRWVVLRDPRLDALLQAQSNRPRAAQSGQVMSAGYAAPGFRAAPEPQR